MYLIMADIWDLQLASKNSPLTAPSSLNGGGHNSGPGQLIAPADIAVDDTGNVYVVENGGADTPDARILKFTANGAYLAQWGSFGSGSGQFVGPEGISVYGGYVYVADTHNHRIQKLTTDGQYVSQWDWVIGGSDQPQDWLIDIAVDGRGNVYVADYHNSLIQMFTATGAYLTRWGSGASGAPQVTFPAGIAVDDNNNVYLTDGVTHSIHKLTAEGSHILKWGQRGSQNGQFNNPHAVTVDRDGYIYVADVGNSRIQKFTADGVYLTQWSPTKTEDGVHRWPSDIVVDSNGNVYVVEIGSWPEHSRIEVFTTGGSFLRQWAGFGSERPGNIAVDSNANLYVTVDDRVLKFSADGIYLTEWGGYGSANGRFLGAGGIVVDHEDNIYVVDVFNHRVQKFAPDGRFLLKWGSYGGKAGQFMSPSDIAINENGDIYVVDNRIIQQFVLEYPQPDPVSGLIHNGSFESTALFAEWTTGGSLPVVRAANATHGNYALQLGEVVPQDEQDLGEAWVHQTIYVDPAWVTPQLSFRYRMFVNDILDYSDFFVAVQDGVGLNHLATILRDGYRPCTPGVAPAPGTDLRWRRAVYDLSAFKGQHVRIVFSNRNLWPQSWGIWSLVDDVRVVDAGAQGPPSGAARVFLPAVSSVLCDPVPKATRPTTLKP